MLENKDFLDGVWKKYSDYSKNKTNDKFYTKHYCKNTEGNRIIRSLAMVMLVVTLGFGVTYAGTYIYEKIWKEPETYSSEEIRQITPNDVDESLTKDEAINIARKITENLGKNFGNVVRAEMNKIDIYDLNWYIDTDTKISVSIDAKTGKLKYGHRGANHPVKDLTSNRVYITSQNHGYYVLEDSLDPNIAEVSHINLNDGNYSVKLKHAPTGKFGQSETIIMLNVNKVPNFNYTIELINGITKNDKTIDFIRDINIHINILSKIDRLVC